MSLPLRLLAPCVLLAFCLANSLPCASEAGSTRPAGHAELRMEHHHHDEAAHGESVLHAQCMCGCHSGSRVLGGGARLDLAPPSGPWLPRLTQWTAPIVEAGEALPEVPLLEISHVPI